MVSSTTIRPSILIALLILLLRPLGLSAQKIEVDVPREVEVGSPFSISYVVHDLGNTRASIAAHPTHSGLELLYGPAKSESRSINVVNGQVTSTSSLRYTYTLLASDKGSYSIGGFALELSDERTLQAPSKTVKALAGARADAGSNGGQQGGGRKQYHYMVIVGKRSVYEQEALPITYKLYAQSGFSLLETKAPVYDGFISHNLKDGSATQIVREEYQGQLYNTVEMYKELIYPQKAGRLEIPANRATIQVPLEVEESIFLGQLGERTLATQPISIEVKPLPEHGKPADFSGGVGQFALQRSISTQAPKTNEAFSLKIVLKGSGNLKMARLPELTFPSGLEVYPPTDQTEDSQQGSTVTTTRTIEYSIIPRETGRYTLPALSLSYFDPKAEQYKTFHARGEDISVSLGKILADADDVVSGSPASRRDLSQLLSYSPGTTAPRGLGFVCGWLYPLCYGLIALLVYLLTLWIKRAQARRADVWGYGASRAGSVATKRLRLAHRYCQEGKADAFYEEALRAMWEYVGNKLMLPSAELSRARVASLLSERGIATREVDEWTKTMDDIEYARFAPPSEDLNPQALYDRAARIITHIESHIH